MYHILTIVDILDFRELGSIIQAKFRGIIEMDEQELSQIFGPENQQLEYKRVLPPPKALAQVISSLANTDGGKIVVGVVARPDRTIGIEGFSEDIPVQDVIHAALASLRPYPHISYHYQYVDGKSVLVINVEKSSGPTLSQEGYYYIRKGTHNVPATADDFRKALVEVPEVRQAEAKRAEANFKTPPAEETDVNYIKVDQLLKRLKESKNHATQSMLTLADHYASLFRLVDRSSDILYQTETTAPTTVVEGKVLLRLIVASLVDTFERYLTDLMYEIFLAKPETLMSESPVTVREVLKCQDMDKFIRFTADKRVSGLSRGDIGSFIDLFKKSYHFEVFNDTERTNAEELFEIRHLYTHRNGRVDAKFLSKCPQQSLNLGEEYEMSIDELCEKANFLMDVVERLDHDAVAKYNLGTFTRE